MKFLDEEQFGSSERSERHLKLRETVKQHLVPLQDEVARWRQDPNFAVTEAMTGSAYTLRGYIKLHEYLARKFTTKVSFIFCQVYVQGPTEAIYLSDEFAMSSILFLCGLGVIQPIFGVILLNVWVW